MFKIQVRVLGSFQSVAYAGNIGEAHKAAEEQYMKGWRNVRIVCPDGLTITAFGKGE